MCERQLLQTFVSFNFVATVSESTHQKPRRSAYDLALYAKNYRRRNEGVLSIAAQTKIKLFCNESK
jgi:hypothetical protein